MNKIMKSKMGIILNNQSNKITKAIINPQNKVKVTNKVRSIFIGFVRSILVFGLSFVILFPIFQQLTLALRAPIDINDPTAIWIPNTWSTFTMKIAATMLNYKDALLHSLRVSFVVMVGQILVTSISGYAFAKLKFKGSGLLFLVVVTTILIPPQALSVSRFLYFLNFDIFGIIKFFNGNSLNLLRSRWSLYLMTFLGMGINSGLFIYIFRQFFRGLPYELDESAQVDGASVFRTFWSVMLPNARPAMVTVGLFAFVWQYNDVYYTNLLQVGNDLDLLSVNLSNAMVQITNALYVSGADKLVGGDISNNPYYFALVSNTAALLVMLPLLIIFIFLQKQFVEGIERTGLVG
jgi:multiple sugar transport system permease protein